MELSSIVSDRAEVEAMVKQEEDGERKAKRSKFESTGQRLSEASR